MGAVKKVVKKLTGADKQEKKAREAEENARREAEENARRQAELEAAQNAATSTGQVGEGDTEVNAEETNATKKKKLASGRKSLTVARSGGSGINI